MPQMPDSRIALGGTPSGPGPQRSPMGTLGQMMQIKEQQQVAQQRERQAELERRAIEDDDETRSALQQYEQPDDAIDHLWKAGRPNAAAKLGTAIYADRKAKSDEYLAKITNHSKRLEQAAQILQGVTDDASLATARPAVVQLVEPIFGTGVNDMIPTTYDEKKIKGLINSGTSRALKLQAEHQATLEFQNGWQAGLIPGPDGFLSPNGQAARQSYRNGLSNVLSLAQTKTEWDYYRINARKQGAPKEVIEEFGPWDEEDGGAAARDRAGMLGLTGAQQATLDAAEMRRGGGRGGLTRAQGWQLEDIQDKENEETESWFKEAYKKDWPREMWPEVTSETTGITKRVNPDAAPNLDRLSDANKELFVKKKIGTMNKFLRRRGDPSLEDQAKTAAKKGDGAAYAKVREIYNGLAIVKKLEDVVPPPDGFTASDYTPKENAGAGGPRVANTPASRPNPAATKGKRTPAETQAEFKRLEGLLASSRDEEERAEINRQLSALLR